MRVRIICYEDVNGWILGKFALRLNEELIKLGIDSDIGKIADPNADINHHIIYTYCDASTLGGNHTLMVTHIDDIRKLNLLRKQLSIARLGICMSKSLVNQLREAGLPAEKLCYVNPAHDQVMVPRPYVIGISSKVHPDGCKREDMLTKLSDNVSPQLYSFKIMGSGWEEIVNDLKKKGFVVSYYPEFNYSEYLKFIPSLDYYIYFGLEEGSMGFIDALAAGVKTIVTVDGYHKDAENGIVHPFVTMEELITVFMGITQERQKLIDSVARWTWRDYAIKHLELWKYITNEIVDSKSSYPDGLNSLLNKEKIEVSERDADIYEKNLTQGMRNRKFNEMIFRLKKLGKPKLVFKKLKSLFSSNKLTTKY